MKTMGHKLQTRLISALLVFVMVFAAIVSAGLAINYDFGDMFSALGFGFGKDSGTNLALNTTNPGSFITAEGNYGYEITASSSKLTVDGVRDAQYTVAGMKLTSNYIMPKSSASKFDVYFAADDTNLYVLYEFSKAEQIFYDSAYASDKSRHHFDLAEFNLNLAGTVASGSTLQILGYKEGGVGTALVNGSVPAAVTDYYVKHTGLGGYGYNVEFCIPLSQITGTYGGAKAMTFSALSTIATAYDSATKAAPTRSYTFAQNAWGDAHLTSTDANTPKSNPSTLIIKESPAIFATYAGNRGDYIVKSETAISLDGVRDSIYDTNGITMPSVYGTGRGTFNFSVAADGDYVYFLYEMTKTSSSNLYYHEDYSNPPYASGWHFDGADFILGLNGKEGSGDKVEFHMNAKHEGYAVDPSTGAAGTAVSYDGAISNSKLDNFYVKHITTPGSGTSVKYNIEARVRYDQITGSVNGFPSLTYLPIAAMCEPNGAGAFGATYPFAATSAGNNSNNAKNARNMIVVVDSESDIVPVQKESDTTVVPEAEIDYTTPYGGYGYFLNPTDKTTSVDGYRDVSYADGLKFSNKYNRASKFGDFTYPVTPDPDNTYTLYMTADENKIYFLYEFTDENIVIDAASAWYNDGVQFSFNEKGLANASAGNNSVYYTTGPRIGTVLFGTVAAPYCLVKTDVGYNVEFVINRSDILNSDTFAFVGRSTLADSATQRTYGFTENATGASDDNAVTKFCNQVYICDINDANNSSPVDGVVADGGANGDELRWKYYIVESDGTFTNDGILDEAYADGLVFNQAYNRIQYGLTNDRVLINNYFKVYVAADADNLYYFYEVTDDAIVSNAPSSSTHWNDSLHFRMDKTATKHGGLGGNQVIQVATEVTRATFGQQEQTFTYSVKHTDKGYNVEISVPRAGFANGGTSFSWIGVASIAWHNAEGDFGGNTYGFTASAGGDATDLSLQQYANLFEIVDEKPNTSANIGDLYNDINAPVAGADSTATDIFTTIKNSGSSVAIVYPKDATQGLLDMVQKPTGTVRDSASATKTSSGILSDYYNSLATLKDFISGSTVYEEGNASISSKTYKIYVGYVNTAPEIKTLVETVGYDKYAVGVYDNNVYILGATEQMLEKAIETFKAEANGTLAGKTLYYGTSPAVVGAALPYVENAKIVTDNGYGAYQIVTKATDLDTFNAYCDALIANGYLLQSYNPMGGGYITKTFYNATDIVTVAFGLRYSMLLYSTESGKNFYDSNDANLDETEMGMSVSVASRAVSELPENKTDYEKVTDTVFVHATQDWDLVEIVRLENGEFIIFDAAHTGDATAILTELYKLSGGAKPVVAGWFLSHFHQDHIGGLVEIGMKYSDFITVKSVIQQIGSEHLQGTCYNYRGNQPSTSDKANILNFLPAMENLGAKVTTAVTGQVYNFANASVEVLYTFADSMPFRMAADDTNRTGAIFSLTLRSGNTYQRFNINGDTTTEEFNMSTKRYGSYLKADFVQVAHHGRGEANDRCTLYYKTIDPDYVIISRSYDIGTNLNASDSAIIDYVKTKQAGKYTNVDDIIIYAATDPEGDGTYAQAERYLQIPYTAGAYVTVGEFSFPGIGATFTPVFNNTATGTEDSDNGAAANEDNRITMPVGMLENGSYLYVANTFYGDIPTDGTKEDAYTHGIHLKSNKIDSPAQNDASFDAYLVAGQDGKIHVFYEVVDNYWYAHGDKSWGYAYRQDGVDFYYGFGTPGTVASNIRIKAVNGEDAQKAVYGDGKITSILKDDYAVVVTALDGGAPVQGQPVKYTVEFTIDNNGEDFTNGDMFTFGLFANSINAFMTGDNGWDEDAGTGHMNTNLTVDNAVSSASGLYHNPLYAPSQGKHSVVVFSSAPATAQAQRPAEDSDDNACNPAEDVVFDKELVQSVDKSANNIFHNQYVYGIGTAYTDIITDGVKDNIYNFGYKVSDKYYDNGDPDNVDKHGFDAYIVYAQDGKVHVFVEVTDGTMTTDASGNKIGYGFEAGNLAQTWRRDSVHFYYNFSTDGTTSNNSAKTIWIGAVAGDSQDGATGTYFVKMTDVGYNVEFILDRDFVVGDYFEFGLYLNCASSEVYNQGNDTYNTDKFSMTHGSYYIDNVARDYVSPNEYAFDGIKIVTSASITDGVDVAHTYMPSTTAPSCTAGGYTTYTCTTCGDSYVADHTDVIPHDYVAGVCSMCGHTIKINSASLLLSDSIAINFLIRGSQLLDGQEFVKMVFEINGEIYTIDEVPAPNANGEYIFCCNYLAPFMMGDTVNATAYFSYNGQEYPTKVQPYSILQYANTHINRASNPASLKKLLVDMLNYGAAAQLYVGYKVDSLVNSHLTAAQLALGTPANEVPALASNQYFDGNNNADATRKWNSATLLIEDKVNVKAIVTLPSHISNYVVKATCAGQTYVVTNVSEDATAGRYVVIFDMLTPAQLRENIAFTVYDTEGNAVTATLNYSVEHYAYRNAVVSQTDAKDLLITLIKYGDSVEAYAN